MKRIPLLLLLLLLLLVPACAGRQQSAQPAQPHSETRGTALFYSPAGAQPARPERHMSGPRYPDVLRRGGVEGEVVAHFVVDTTGLVLPGSLRVIRATDPLFVDAVRQALPALRFQAATLNGRAVRQLVEQAVYFDVIGGAAAARRLPAPRPVPTTDPSVRTPMPLGAIIVTATTR